MVASRRTNGDKASKMKTGKLRPNHKIMEERKQGRMGEWGGEAGKNGRMGRRGRRVSVSVVKL